MYDSINDAAKGLLGEATSIADKCGKEYAVCGGWSPVLRNTARISHPGTRDVDLLFSSGAAIGSLKDVVSAFLDCGYFASAKHPFQVLRLLPVKDKTFVFNVDLLHPHEGEIEGELCVDQLSLPIPQEDFASNFVCLRSMALPNAGFVFDGYIAKQSVDFRMPNGTTSSHVVPVIDEKGLLVTKAKSCKLQKRPRDIFDIYLAISSPQNLETFRSQIQRLKATREEVFVTLGCIGEGLSKWEKKFKAPEVFTERGVRFEDAAAEIRQFLENLGFDQTAGEGSGNGEVNKHSSMVSESGGETK